jgi:RimJ/RimL family protein N-acetyltransferase
MNVELFDGDIMLRTTRAEDTGALYEAVCESKNELQPWMPWCHPEYSMEDSETFINSREEGWNRDTDYTFVICDALTGEWLGIVGLNSVNRQNRWANLGYWVRSTRTRRGVASTATRLLARYGLTELGLNRIEIIMSVKNLASQRVAEKAGAHREGIARKRLLYYGQPHDSVIYSLVAEDFNLEK